LFILWKTKCQENKDATENLYALHGVNILHQQMECPGRGKDTKPTEILAPVKINDILL